MVADEAFFITGASASTASNPNPENARRSLVMISVLIYHPEEGLILFETGAGKDYPKVWGPQLVDLFAREGYTEDMELDAQIKLTGNDIKDVKAVIIGHLHIDHAGGLEHFRNTDVPIYTHELELKHAFYSVASKTDLGASLGFARGIFLHHCPGHTPGLCIAQINLKDSGTWVLTSDQYVVQENYDSLAPQGWLTRDHHSWSQSNQMIHFLQKTTGAKLIFGHDREVLMRYKLAPSYYA
ncbi:unnamed protein product, partial [Aureobasidium uvarum]